jgi:hypothetical protein
MSLMRAVNVSFHGELTPAAKRILVTTAMTAGLAVLMLGSRPIVADEPESESQAASTESAEMSAREKRREERRREREESRSAESATDEVDQAPATDGTAPIVFVVAVEPEMECRRVAVLGSRVPKEVCTPVGQRDVDEENAQEFLRRTQERSTIVHPCPTLPPGLPGPAASVC